MNGQASMHGRLTAIASVAVLATLLLSALTSLGSPSISSVAPSATQSSPSTQVTRSTPVVSSDVPRSPVTGSSSTTEPMGISDNGVGASGSKYTYTSNSFQGTTTINSFTVDKGPSWDPNSATIQLNVVLAFLDSGQTYVYWIQDVALVNTSTHIFSFENNIWNFSSSSASMYSSTVAGNGSVLSGGPYYYGAPNSYNLSYPSTIVLTATTSVNSKGVPIVEFQYNCGTGTITYDTVSFVFVKNLYSSSGFVVSGSSTTPLGLSYDAELVLGGPGSGSAVTAKTTAVQMELDYWNGYNYEAIPNAHNYGFDTAEAVKNVIDRGYYYNVNGTLFANLTAGSTTLSLIWTSGQLALIQVTTQPYALSASLSFNGTTGTGFQYGEVIVRVGPGAYSLVILAPDVYDLVGSTMATVGSSTTLQAAYLYSVNFGESTLPSGTNWSITLGSDTEWSGGSVVVPFYISNGTWAYSVGYVPGYTASNISGTVHVNGKNRGITITFEELFTVTFREIGLPSGTWWNVSIDNGSLGIVRTNSNSVGTYLPNGTYIFTVSHVAGYTVVSYTKLVSVAGRSFGLKFYFTAFEYTITFSEKGLASGTVWSVTINGHAYSTNGTSISVPLPNGTYSFKFHAKGYKVRSGPSSPLTVNGAALNEKVRFKP
jgi:hypothetical protein